MEASVFENCNKLTIYGEKGSYAEIITTKILKLKKMPIQQNLQ